MIREQPTNDLIDQVVADHEEIKSMFSAVESATGDEKTSNFQKLIAKLAMHEAAEEIVVHPLLRKAQGGDAIADELLHQEEEGKKLLAEIEAVAVDDPRFDSLLQNVKAEIVKHAENEQAREHPRIRETVPQDQLHALCSDFRANEATSPTHPPSSATGNI